MSRRTVAIVAVSVLGVLAVVVGGGYWSLKQEPAFYAEELSRPVNPARRKEEAKAFVQATLQLVDEVKHDDRWAEEFTQDQVNAWLAEELPRKYSRWLPPNTSDPRIKLEANAVELAFRSSDPRFEGVISGRFEPFVAGPNRIGIRIRRVRLGLVPLPIDQVIEQLGDSLDRGVAKAGMSMEWQQEAGEDVLVLELKDDGKPVLEGISVRPGTIAISGKRQDDGQRAGAAVPPQQTAVR